MMQKTRNQLKTIAVLVLFLWVAFFAANSLVAPKSVTQYAPIVNLSNQQAAIICELILHSIFKYAEPIFRKMKRNETERDGILEKFGL